jgi:hypothetical protein
MVIVYFSINGSFGIYSDDVLNSRFGIQFYLHARLHEMHLQNAIWKALRADIYC